MMQNITGLASLISNAGEKNFSARSIQVAGGAASFASPLSFQEHLESAVKPAHSQHEDPQENSYYESLSARDEKTEETRTEKETNEAGDQMKDERIAANERSEKKSEESQKYDETNKYTASTESQKTPAVKKSEKQSEEKSKSLSDSRNSVRQQTFQDGIMNEFIDKISKRESGRMNSDLVKNKMKSVDTEKKSNNEETVEKTGLRIGNELKNRDGVMVTLDPEKWKVHGRVEHRENSIQVNPDKKNTVLKKDNQKSSADDSGEKSRGKSSSIPSDIKNMFADAGEVRNSPLARSQNFADQVKSENKNMFNELVDRARLNLGPDGNSTASIRMNPENLGRLTMNLRVMDNSLEAKILVDSEAAKKLIMDDIENLKLELKSQGIQVDSFTVKIRESFFSQMEGDQQNQNSFFNSGNDDHSMFSESGGGDDSFFDNFTNQISEMIDDGEYGSFTSEENLYEGAVNLSV